ncbi:MAG: dienelactone hydrolase family protein [Burkholderiales bacterium]|nr:dienelactone hydrolase family protein [Burkholderiales bacterium]
MTVLIATDVFGITPALASLVRSLGCECLLVSPFDDPDLYFQSEQKAYHAFLTTGGVARYADKVSALLHENSVQEKTIRMAIGFSAGASALWMCCARTEARQLQAAVLFYGSRIRDHKDLQPICPLRLIFAEKEAAFDAVELTQELQRRGHQAELARTTSHGFMNPYSRGFDVKIQAMYLEQLAAQIQDLHSANPRSELACA